MARKPWGSPAQRAALAKARAASVKSARRRRLSRNHGRAPKAANRGIGWTGLKKNFTPYVRVNKNSQTIGFNSGTIRKSGRSRVVYGVYRRVEAVDKKNNPIDKTFKQISNQLAPKNTRRGRAKAYVKKNVVITNPALRVAVGTGEARLSTSRRAGPTVTVRRGTHNSSPQASKKAIKRYDTQMRRIKARKQRKPRPQRRNANRG